MQTVGSYTQTFSFSSLDNVQGLNLVVPKKILTPDLNEQLHGLMRYFNDYTYSLISSVQEVTAVSHPLGGTLFSNAWLNLLYICALSLILAKARKFHEPAHQLLQYLHKKAIHYCMKFNLIPSPLDNLCFFKGYLIAKTAVVLYWCLPLLIFSGPLALLFTIFCNPWIQSFYMV